MPSCLLSEPHSGAPHGFQLCDMVQILRDHVTDEVVVELSTLVLYDILEQLVKVFHYKVPLCKCSLTAGKVQE